MQCNGMVCDGHEHICAGIHQPNTNRPTKARRSHSHHSYMTNKINTNGKEQHTRRTHTRIRWAQRTRTQKAIRLNRMCCTAMRCRLFIYHYMYSACTTRCDCESLVFFFLFVGIKISLVDTVVRISELSSVWMEGLIFFFFLNWVFSYYNSANRADSHTPSTNSQKKSERSNNSKSAWTRRKWNKARSQRDQYH